MTGHALISKIRSRALQIYIKQTAELEQKFYFPCFIDINPIAARD
jgi:hypothetical protein